MDPQNTKNDPTQNFLDLLAKLFALFFASFNSIVVVLGLLLLAVITFLLIFFRAVFGL